MKQWLWLIPLLFVAGCSSTRSGIEKTYDVRITVSGGSMAEFFMGVEAETEGTTASGDAPADASVDPAIALGMQGSTTSAAAKGAEQALKEIISYAEQRLKQNAENTTTTETTETTNNEGDTVTEPTGETPTDGSGTSDPTDTDASNETLTFDCSGTMSYRDCDTCESVPQTICMLDTWDKCSDIPFQPFKVTWVDSSGNTRSLDVPDKCGIAMLSKEEGYGKFRYEHDKPPFKPVTYAPRGFNAVKVVVEGK